MKGKTSLPSEPIAIIGIGCRFPGGAHDPKTFWKLLCDGADAVSEISPERWNVDRYFHPEAGKPGKSYSKWAGQIEDIDQFDPQFFGFTPKEAALIDPQQRLLLEVTWQALEDAGQPIDLAKGTNTGVFVGISTNDYEILQTSGNSFAAINPFSTTGVTMSLAANRISYCLNLRGPSVPVDTACSSSLIAVHFACSALRNRECETAIAAGVNIIAGPIPFIAFSSMGMLSPDGQCKAFDATANGFVRGEGAGAILLKPLSAAITSGDPIHAVIRATGINQDGRTPGITVPNRDAQESLVLRACEDACIRPSAVQYVEAHGTGTPVGDPIEANALGGALSRGRRNGRECVIGSVKTNIGHLEAAAGVAGIIKAALAVEHGLIPPSLHFDKPNPQIDFTRLKLRVPDKIIPFRNGKERPIAGVNSFGWGGANAHALLEAPPATKAASVRDARRAWLIPLSARAPEALADTARDYVEYLRRPGTPALRDIAYSAAVRRTHFEHRIAFAGRTKRDLARQMEEFARGESRKLPSQAATPARVAFVFSGQGPQWWRMGRDLLEREPIFRAEIERCDALLGEFAPWSLLAELTADESNSRLDRTGFAQPAIFALQVALAALWRSWGVEPAGVVGHSVGEVAAAYVAGVFDLRDAIRIIFHRGDTMEHVTAVGRMLAVGLPAASAQKFVDAHPRRVFLAAVNSPSTVTLSGDPEALDAIAAELGEQEVFSRFVPVHYAFHSAQMDPVEPELRKALTGLAPREAKIPIASTVTGQFASGSEFDSDYWWRNVREPVQFAAGVAALIESGCRTFIELGAHPILSSAAQECLRESGEHGAVIASLQRESDDQATMLAALGSLHSLGHPVNWGAIFPRNSRFVHVPRYPLQRQRCWSEPEVSKELRLKPAPHPFLDRRVQSSDPCWEVRLDRRIFPYLTDHRIQGRALFPAAGFLEMALATARELFGPGTYELENLDLHKALFLPEGDEQPTLQITYYANDSSFVIASRTHDSARTWTTHATGKMRLLNRASLPAPLPIEATRQRCPTQVTTDGFYQLLHEGGLQYGPAFRGVERVWRRDMEMLARVSVPDRVVHESSHYLIHPAYLDSCFQAGFLGMPIGKYGDEPGVFLPVHMDRLQFFASPDSSGLVHGEITQCAPRSCGGNFHLIDDAGNVRVQLSGCRWLLVDGTSREIDQWLYELQWHLKPLASAAAAERPLRFLPKPKAIAHALTLERDRLRNESTAPQQHRRVTVQLDALCSDYILAAFAKCGWRPKRGERVTLDRLAKRCGIQPAYTAFLGRLIEQLEAQGILRKLKGKHAWSFSRMPRLLDRAVLWQSALSLAPSLAPELVLLDRLGPNLASILRGDSDPQEIAFPGGATIFFEQLCSDSPGFRTAHRLIEKALIDAIAERPEGHTLRILDLGGHCGAATARILPRLRRERIDYLCAESSEKLLADTQRKFQDAPSVRFQLLDILADPVGQGLELGSVDLIVASHALDRVREAETALTHLRRLLAPGGILILAASQRFPRWLDLILGALHPELSLRSGSEWKALLNGHGLIEADGIEDGHDSLLIAKAPIDASNGTASAEPVAQVTEATGSWLILADEGGTADALARLLQHRGDDCVLLRKVNATAMDRAWEDFITKPNAHAVVHLWNLDAPPADALDTDDLDGAQEAGCLSVLRLAQVMACTERADVPPLWVVTRGAQPAGETPHPLSIAQSPVIGLARVIRTEQPNLRCRVVDLDPIEPPHAVGPLVSELLADEIEEEIAFRGDARYVQRVGHGTLPPPPKTSRRFAPIHRHPCRLEIPKPGLLDRLTLAPVTRRKPGADEVEIEVAAAGLNFRDVMKALGIYPTEAEDAGVLGDECSGRIVAAGKKVKGLRVGDEVMAIAPGCFASHVTIHSALVLPKPKHLSFEEAATMLIAYLTAHYALNNLAHLRKGERVLIHAAAGGVGFAAVRVAQEIGAEIFATAGNDEKRAFLRACGVRHIMDSRTLDFADEIMERTGGRGVDVVLNSLAGEAISRSLSVLGPRGRFLEIGKRDIYQDTKLGLRPFRNNLSFFAVDLSRAMHPDFIREFSGRQREFLRTNLLTPLPYRVFPLTDAVAAFRHMAQARQVGKVVLTVAGERIAPPPRLTKARTDCTERGTYLITGGLGGFGLTVAGWLAVKGARHLVLMSRNGMVTDESRASVQALREAGVQVVIARGDVGRKEDVRKVLRQINRTLPPLRGIMHAAMVIDDGMLMQLTEERFRRVMAPKMRGAWNLHRLTMDLPLDFFVLFSSAAAVVGNPGQANYVAANVFLDALAHHRHALGLPALSVNWGFLTEIGYVARTQQLQEHFARIGWTGITPRKSLQMLARLIPAGVPQMAVARIDWSTVPARISSAPRYSLLMSEAVQSTDAPSDAAWIREAVMNVPPAEGRRIIENYLREQIAKVMRIPAAKLSVDRPLTELGLDSLMAVELINRVEGQLGTAVPTGKLIGGPTIARIAAIVLEMLTGAPASASVEPTPARVEGSDFTADVALAPDISFGSPSAERRQFEQPQALFLTGATSLLGAFLLHELIEKTSADLYCLVAAPSVEEGRILIEDTLEKYGLAPNLNRIVPVAGDLTAPRFGLLEAQFAALTRTISAIYHAGAEAHHAAPYDKLKHINVDAVQTILRLASASRMKPVHYLSSASVLMATSRTGTTAVREDDALENPRQLDTGYSQTRWVAEKILELARANGLPVNIYRPGLIIGDSRTGATASDDVWWRLLKACIELGCGATDDAHTLLTPVDYVAAATVALSLDADLANRTYHLINEAPCTSSDVLEAARGFGYAIDILPEQAWDARIKKAANQRAVDAVRPYALLIPSEYDDVLRRMRALGQIDCSGAKRELDQLGIACPPVDEAVLQRCLDYLVRVGFLPAPPRRMGHRKKVRK